MSKKIELYSELDPTMVVMRALATMRGAVIPKKGSKDYMRQVNELRYQLARKQHEKLQTMDSFRELERCELIMFESNRDKSLKIYESKFEESTVSELVSIIEKAIQDKDEILYALWYAVNDSIDSANIDRGLKKELLKAIEKWNW